jgi:hypothetical protein
MLLVDHHAATIPCPCRLAQDHLYAGSFQCRDEPVILGDQALVVTFGQRYVILRCRPGHFRLDFKPLEDQRQGTLRLLVGLCAR